MSQFARFAFLICLVGSLPLAMAQEQQADKLEAVITAVRGIAQVRMGDDQPWQKAQIGMKLTEGAEFRTGPRSGVQFKLPPNQTVTLDRLGTVKLLTAIKEAGVDKYKTDIGMTYGRTRYNIETGGGAVYQSSIVSPSATLSVKGTDTGAEEGPFGFSHWTNVGSTDSFNRKTGRQYRVGAGGETNNNSRGPANFAKGNTRGTDDRTQDNVDKNTTVDNPNVDIRNIINNNRGFQNRFNNVIIDNPGEVFADVNTTLAVFPVNIFDNGTQDNDRVSITFNGQVLNPDLSLKTAGTVFNLNLNLGVNTFTATHIDSPVGALTGRVTAPHPEGPQFDFSMPQNAVGEQRTLRINRTLGED